MAETRLTGNLALSRLAVSLVEAGRSHIELAGARIEPFEAVFGDMTVHARSLVFQRARTPTGSVASSIECDGVVAENVTLRGSSFELTADRLECSEGLTIKDRRDVTAPSIRVVNLRLAFQRNDAAAGGEAAGGDVSGQTEGGGSAAAGAEREAAGDQDASGDADAGDPDPDDPGSEPPRRDLSAQLSCLDALSGHLNVDLFVDLNGPLIGRRKETHEFRIPIDRGTIDYERLEGDVRWLERSFLDVEVVDEKLVLERAILGLPFTSKALMWWPLDGEELALASQNRVKLTTLLRWQLPPAESDRRKKGSSVRFNQVTAQNIDLHVTPEPGVSEPLGIELGRFGRVWVVPELPRSGDEAAGSPLRSAVSITGALHFQSREALRDTQLVASTRGLCLAADQLLLGSATISATQIVVTDVDRLGVTFDGYVPHTVDGAAASMVGRDLRITSH